MTQPNQQSHPNQGQHNHGQQPSYSKTQPVDAANLGQKVDTMEDSNAIQKDYSQGPSNDLSFRDLLAELSSQVIDGHITSQQSKQFMHNWWRAKSLEEKAAFIADRNKADETINYFKGVMDTLVQELPYMLSGM
jgi:hypothetical protein